MNQNNKKNVHHPPIDWRANKKINRDRITSVLSLCVLVYGGVSMYISHQSGGNVFFGMMVMALLFMIYVYVMTYFSSLVVSGFDHRSPSRLKPSDKQLLNVLEEIQIASGDTFVPELIIIKSKCLNVYSGGFSSNNAVIAITEGLLNSATRDELQAVIAHAYSRILNQDTKLVTICTTLMAMARWSFQIILGLMVFVFAFGSFADNVVYLLALLASGILYLVIPSFVGESRILMADMMAVQYTRVSEPMTSVLNKIYCDHVLNELAYDDYYNLLINQTLCNSSYFFEPMHRHNSVVFYVSQFAYPSMQARLHQLGGKAAALNNEIIQKMLPKPVMVTDFAELDRAVRNPENEDRELMLSMQKLISGDHSETGKKSIDQLIAILNGQSIFVRINLIDYESLMPDLQQYLADKANDLTMVLSISIRETKDTQRFTRVFAKICQRNNSKTYSGSHDQVVERISLTLILQGLTVLEEQKKAIRDALALIQKKRVTSLEIIGFYGLDSDMKEYFLLMIESVYHLEYVSNITLVRDDVSDQPAYDLNAPPEKYQLRINTIVNNNTIQKDLDRANKEREDLNRYNGGFSDWL